MLEKYGMRARASSAVKASVVGEVDTLGAGILPAFARVFSRVDIFVK
jgi:hypothetical protein